MKKKKKTTRFGQREFEKEKRKRQGSDKENIEKEKENDKVRTTGFNGSKRATLRAIKRNNGFQMWPKAGSHWHYFGRPQRKHKKDPCLCFRWCAHFVPLGLHFRPYWPRFGHYRCCLLCLLGLFWAPIGTILADPNGSTRRTHACASVGGLILCLLGSIFGYTFVLLSPWEMKIQ